MIQDFLLVYSSDFDVVSEDGKYQVVTRSHDEANDLLLLNPKKRFAEGTKVSHLSGERKKMHSTLFGSRNINKKGT